MCGALRRVLWWVLCTVLCGAGERLPGDARTLQRKIDKLTVT